MATEGWALIPRSRKRHYFTVDGASHCGKRFVDEIPAGIQPDRKSDHLNKSNCIACRRAVAAGKERCNWVARFKGEREPFPNLEPI